MKISNNTVSAPVKVGGSARQGIRVDFGIQGIPQNPPPNTDFQNYINAQNPGRNGPTSSAAAATFSVPALRLKDR
jgi:hypothetical protein